MALPGGDAGKDPPGGSGGNFKDGGCGGIVKEGGPGGTVGKLKEGGAGGTVGKALGGVGMGLIENCGLKEGGGAGCGRRLISSAFNCTTPTGTFKFTGSGYKLNLGNTTNSNSPCRPKEVEIAQIG